MHWCHNQLPKIFDFFFPSSYLAGRVIINVQPQLSTLELSANLVHVANIKEVYRMLLIVGVKPSKVKQVAWILSPFPLLVHFGIEYIGVLSLKNTKKLNQ